MQGLHLSDRPLPQVRQHELGTSQRLTQSSGEREGWFELSAEARSPTRTVEMVAAGMGTVSVEMEDNSKAGFILAKKVAGLTIGMDGGLRKWRELH